MPSQSQSPSNASIGVWVWPFFGGKLVRRLVLGVLEFCLLEFWPKLLGIRLLEAYEKASEIAT